MFIYLITNKINGKQYVGLTVRDVSKRIAKHIYSNTRIGIALRKYGLESFNISVIDSALDMDILKEKEKYWIKLYGSKAPNGYNFTDGGDGILGYRHKQETKDYLRKASTGNRNAFGHKVSDGARRKLSEAGMGKKNALGHIPNEAIRQQWSEAHKNMTKETRQKMSEAKKGTKRTEATKKKISETLRKQRRRDIEFGEARVNA